MGIPSTSPQSSWLNRDWVWGSILVLAVFAAYSPVWWAGFVWDDNPMLTNNPCVVGPLGLKEIWTTSAADICPLTLSTFWLVHKIWGLAPLPYHVFNVLLHGLSAVVLWQVLRILQIPGAWLGAALWALHPVMVESVAWVVELKNVESGLFFLLSILYFLRSAKAQDPVPQKSFDGNYLLSLLFAALAMASKSSTVILPVVLCFCAWWIEGRWQWRNILKLSPVFLMSMAAGSLSLWTQEVLGPHDPQLDRTWIERLVMSGDAVWFYLEKLIWPYPLITIYPRGTIDTGLWTPYLPLLAVIGLSVILSLQRELWARACLFAFAYYLVTVLPVSGLIHMKFFRYAFVADHLQYLPSMGPLALAGAGIATCAEWLIPRKFWLKLMLGGGMLVLLGTLSWQRSWAYENEEIFWTAALARNPDSWAIYNNLGNALLAKSEIDEAITRYQKALEIEPANAKTHNNLGRAFQLKGRNDEAIEEYVKALEGDSGDVRIHYNLGSALSNVGRFDEAIVEFQKALAVDPNFVSAYNDLGVAFAQRGRLDDAIIQFQAALQRNPDYADAKKNLAQAQQLKRAAADGK